MDKKERFMNPENNQSCMETLEALMSNTQTELLKIIKENKEMKIRLAFLEEENKYYVNRRKKLNLVNMGGKE